MNLGDIITTLKTANPDQIVKHGFHNPHSYRGDYYDLAFEPATNITVREMLEAAQSAVGATYQGWKGGDFRMTEADWCWLSEEGSASGETISPLLLQFMLTPPVDKATVLRDFLWRLEQSAGDAAAEKLLDDNPELRSMLDEAQPATDQPCVVAYRSPGTRTLYCVTCARQEPGWRPVTQATDQTLCDFCGGRVLAVASQTLGSVIARYKGDERQEA